VRFVLAHKLVSCEDIGISGTAAAQIVARFTVVIGILAAQTGLSSAAFGGRATPPAAPLTVQLADSSVLPRAEPAPIAASPASVAPEANLLAPAPVPNQDIDAPISLTGTEPRLSPALLSRKKTFEGDGFSHGSGQDYGLDERTPPAPGLNLSVPVK
jgi:hypothetical protein